MAASNVPLATLNASFRGRRVWTLSRAIPVPSIRAAITPTGETRNSPRTVGSSASVKLWVSRPTCRWTRYRSASAISSARMSQLSDGMGSRGGADTRRVAMAATPTPSRAVSSQAFRSGCAEVGRASRAMSRSDQSQVAE